MNGTDCKHGGQLWKKEKAKTKKLLVISFLDVQTMRLNGLEAPYPQFLPAQTEVMSDRCIKLLGFDC